MIPSLLNTISSKINSDRPTPFQMAAAVSYGAGLIASDFWPRAETAGIIVAYLLVSVSPSIKRKSKDGFNDHRIVPPVDRPIPPAPSYAGGSVLELVELDAERKQDR